MGAMSDHVSVVSTNMGIISHDAVDVEGAWKNSADGRGDSMARLAVGAAVAVVMTAADVLMGGRTMFGGSGMVVLCAV